MIKNLAAREGHEGKACKSPSKGVQSNGGLKLGEQAREIKNKGSRKATRQRESQ